MPLALLQISPEESAFIQKLRPAGNKLFGKQQSEIIWSLVDIVNSYHLGKFPKEHYTFTAENETTPFKLTRQIIDIQQTLINEKYHFIARAASYALAAYLIIEKSNIADKARYESIIHNYAAIFIAKAEQLHNGNLTQDEFDVLNKEFKGYLQKLAEILPFREGLEKKYKHLIKAEQFVNWELPRPVYTTCFKLGDVQIEQTTESLQHLTRAQRDEFKHLIDYNKPKPYWFTRLPAWEQRYLTDKVNQEDPQLSNCKSCAERSIPLAANAVENRLVIKDQTGNILHELVSVSHTVLPPIHIRKGDKAADENERLRIAGMDLNQLLESQGLSLLDDGKIGVGGQLKQKFLNHWGLTEEQIPEHAKITLPIIDRGLLSPIPGIDRFEYGENNSRMLDEKAKVIKAAIFQPVQLANGGALTAKLYQPNYPVNGLRPLESYARAADSQREALAFLKNAAAILKVIANIKGDKAKEQLAKIAVFEKSLLDNNIQKSIENLNNLDLKNVISDDIIGTKEKLLKESLSQYLQIYQSKKTSGNNKPLFLASLELLINNQIGGIDMVHCKSAKDRRAIALIHAYAMLIYFNEYDNLPNYKDITSSKERKNFVDIFAKLYCSLHEAEQAGLNSRGSAGIVDPLGITDLIPEDMQIAIGEIMQVSKRAARLNKPKLPVRFSLLSLAILIALGAGIGCTLPFLIPMLGTAPIILAGGVALGFLLGLSAAWLTPGSAVKKALVGFGVGVLVLLPFSMPFWPVIFTSLGITGSFAASLLAIAATVTSFLQAALTPIWAGLAGGIAMAITSLSKFQQDKCRYKPKFYELDEEDIEDSKTMMRKRLFANERKEVQQSTAAFTSGKEFHPPILQGPITAATIDSTGTDNSSSLSKT